MQAEQAETRFTALRVAVFYVAIFSIIGCYMAFLPIWLKWRGLSEAEISLLFALPLLVRVVFTPVISFLADKAGNRREAVFWLAQFSFIVLLALPFTSSTALIYVCLTVYALGWTSIMPLTETIAVAAARRQGVEYGKLRLWGSLSFIGVTAGGGFVIAWGGPQAALWLTIGTSAFVAATAHLLPAVQDNGHKDFAPMRLADMKLFTHSPVFLIFLAATAASAASHAVYYTLASVHWQSLGIPAQTIGFLWAVGVIAEVLLFHFSRHLLDRMAPAALISLAAAAGAIRWTVMAFDPPLGVLFALQLLHALTFGASHLGAIHFLSAAVPERYAATGQGLYAAVAAGIGMGGAYLIAGPLLEALGGRAYLFMAGFAVVALVFARLLVRRWGGDLLGARGRQAAGS